MLTFFRQHQPLRQEVGVHTDGLLSLSTLFMVIVIIAIFKKDIFCPPMTRSETEFFVLFLCVLSKQEIWTAMPRGRTWQRDLEGAQEATSNLIADACRQLLGERMAALFVICGRSNCNCREDSCALKGGQYWLHEQPPEPCSQEPRCAVCSVFTRHLDLCNLLGRASTSKGALFSRLLVSSMAVHQVYDLAVPADLPPGQRVARKQTVKVILCSMLDVERNRLQRLRRIGGLAMLVPKLLCVQLSSGGTLFWQQLRRVSNTVIGQRSQPAKLVTLGAIRRRMPDNSPWKEFLNPGWDLLYRSDCPWMTLHVALQSLFSTCIPFCLPSGYFPFPTVVWLPVEIQDACKRQWARHQTVNKMFSHDHNCILSCSDSRQGGARGAFGEGIQS